MRTIAILGQKGGSGKTTTAIHLAVAAARAGRQVVLLDLDPQGSAAAWGQRRNGSAEYPISVAAARLQEVAGLLTSAKRQGAELVIVDTPGRADIVASAMLERADVSLIPCRASILDVEATRRTAEQARAARADSRAWVVLNATPPAGSRAAEARTAMGGLLRVSPVELGQRVAYGDALNSGLSVEELAPDGAAATEIRRLWRWVASI